MDDPELSDTLPTPTRGRPEPAPTGKGAWEDTLPTATPSVPSQLGVVAADRTGAPASGDEGTVDPVSPPLLRPVYGLRLNGGEPSGLDIPVVVGRRPSDDRPPGGGPQRYLAISSPLREVSANQVRLTPHAENVVVTDLHSTNGTVVILPGAAPVALRPGESLVVGQGAKIILGDGNWVEIFTLNGSGRAR